MNNKPKYKVGDLFDDTEKYFVLVDVEEDPINNVLKEEYKRFLYTVKPIFWKPENDFETSLTTEELEENLKQVQPTEEQAGFIALSLVNKDKL